MKNIQTLTHTREMYQSQRQGWNYVSIIRVEIWVYHIICRTCEPNFKWKIESNERQFGEGNKCMAQIYRFICDSWSFTIVVSGFNLFNGISRSLLSAMFNRIIFMPFYLENENHLSETEIQSGLRKSLPIPFSGKCSNGVLLSENFSALVLFCYKFKTDLIIGKALTAILNPYSKCGNVTRLREISWTQEVINFHRTATTTERCKYK